MSDTSPNCTHRQFVGEREFCPDCGLSRNEVLLLECAPFLKDDETPAECIARNRRDTSGCLTMLIEEKRKTEALRSRLAEVDANAPWLTQAHILCSDHGIPQGNISDRLEMLVGYLAEVERDAARYRWLRGDASPASERWMRWELRRWDGRSWHSLEHAALDAAIDAAMEGGE